MKKMIEEPCEELSVKSVTEALNLMKAGKAARPSGVTSALRKCVKTRITIYFMEKKCLKVGKRAT